MATGVNVKMGVSGITQFKQNIKAAQTSVKTLDQALQLNEKQFKATGDAEAYMQQKSELLKVRIEEQKAVIKNAENALKQMTQQGVDKASAAFQSMQQQLLKAKGELIDTETELENVGTAGKEAGDGVDGMNQQLKRIGDQVSFTKVIGGIDNITSKLSGAARKAGQLLKSLTGSVLGAGSWADDLATRAQAYSRIGNEITPEQLYRMEQTANIIDTDADTIINAQSRLRKAMGQESSEDTMGAFAALGIDPTARHGDWVNVFWEAGDAIMHLGDAVEQEEYAQKIFGRSWGELIPLFSAGRDAWEDMNASWSWIGDDALQNLQEMDDQSQRLNSEWENFQHQMEAAFAPVLTQGMQILTELFQQLNEFLSTPEGQQMLEALGEAVTGLFQDLASIDPEQVLQGFTDVFNKVIEGFQWLYDHREDLKTAFKAILIGGGLLRLISGAGKVVEMITALKGFSLGGGAGAAATAGGGGSLVTGIGGLASGVAAKTLTFRLPAAFLAGGIAVAHRINEEGGIAAVWDSMLDQMGQAMQNFPQKAMDLISNPENAREALHEVGGAFVDLITNPGGNRGEKTSGQQLWNQYLGGEFGTPLTGMETGRYGQYGRLFAGTEELAYSLDDAIERMVAAEQQTGETMNRNTQNSLTSGDLNNFRGLPGEIARAVQSGMANVRIYIDGYQAGRVLTPYVGGAMGGLVTKQKQ